MRSWPVPAVPSLPGRGPRVHLHDTSRGEVVPVGPEEGTATLYVCGITPYDATHLGHANTYVAFDLLGRAWRDAGLDVRYVQNVTDVDDPLLERATATGVDWRDLAASQIDLFRADMEALSVVPPQEYLGVVEAVDLVSAAVRDLLAVGAAYRVPGVDGGPDGDVYFPVASDTAFGEVGGYDRETMLELSAERGGDPQRRASATRWTRCCGGWNVTANRRGTPVTSAAGAPAGTWSARRSRWSTWGCPSTCRPAGPTSSSPTTRWAPRTRTCCGRSPVRSPAPTPTRAWSPSTARR